MAWGVLTSHTRAHGAPPREPWEYDAALTDDFRRALNLRYSLMPYIYAQAKDSSARGFPMLRPLFFEYPNDPTVMDHRRSVHVWIGFAGGADVREWRSAQGLSAAG